MRLSIIIATSNNAAVIGPCLESLKPACAGIENELLVVDNASTDETLARVQDTWPEAMIIRNSNNLGFAAANNQAARIARGRYLLLLNADTLLLDTSLIKALEYAETNRAAILGPKMLGKNGSVQCTWDTRNSVASYLCDLWSLALFLKSLRLARQPVLSGLAPVRFLVGAAMLVERDTFARHGLFDERYFFCCEERDLCLRYDRAGERMFYFPQWVICHYGGGGKPTSRLHVDNWVKTSVLFADKHGSLAERLLMRLVLPILLFTHTLAFLLKGAIGANAAHLKTARVYARALAQIPSVWLMSRNRPRSI